MDVSLKLLNPGSNILYRLKSLHGVNFGPADQRSHEIKHVAILRRLPLSDEGGARELISKIARSPQRFEIRLGRPLISSPFMFGAVHNSFHRVFFGLHSPSLHNLRNQLSTEFKHIHSLQINALLQDRSKSALPRFPIARRLSKEEANRKLEELEILYRQANGYGAVTVIGLSLGFYEAIAGRPRAVNPRTDY